MYINTCVCVCVYGTCRLADQCKQTKPTASRWSDSCLNSFYPSFFGLQILFLPNASLKSGLIRLLMWPTYLLIFVILLYKLYIAIPFIYCLLLYILLQLWGIVLPYGFLIYWYSTTHFDKQIGIVILLHTSILVSFHMLCLKLN